MQRFLNVLQRAIGLMILSAEGEIHQQKTISASGPIHGVEVAAGQFHTLVAMECDSVIFELKQGPYAPMLLAKRRTSSGTFPRKGFLMPNNRNAAGAID